MATMIRRGDDGVEYEDMVEGLQALSGLEEDDHDRRCGMAVLRRHDPANLPPLLPSAKATTRLHCVALLSKCLLRLLKLECVKDYLLMDEFVAM
jgi:hypothetical protein